MIDHHATAVIHGDGSRMFLRDDDRARQDAIAEQLAAAWGVDLIYCGDLAFVDYLAVRDARPVGWVEVISRNYSHDQLMRLGGVFLKRQTFDTLRALDDVQLSIRWRGCTVVYDLADGLYWQLVACMDTEDGTASDPRGAANDDNEPAVLVQNLRGPIT